MKRINVNILVVLLMIFIGFSSTSKSQIISNDTVEVLQTVGLATENGVALNDVTITLYKENEEIEWDEITEVASHDHHFKFNLLGNSYYTIQVSKPGYITRSFGISTVLPADVRINDDNPKTIFQFDVELPKMKKGINDDYLDFPIAMIKYNTSRNKFELDARYNANIKSKIGNTLSPEGELTPQK